jgi:hypothetical protein
MANGTMVVTTLLGSIILCVFGLLIMSFHNPKEMIANEVGSIDRLEGVLRQMLSEQSWPKPTGENAPASAPIADGAADALLQEQLKNLEAELAAKQRQIEAMGANQVPSAEPVDTGPMKQKIKDLEEKLAEYSVIEEDIADLSRFRQENEDLRKKITEATGVPAGEALTMPWDEFEKIVKEKKVKSATEDVNKTIDAPVEKTE